MNQFIDKSLVSKLVLEEFARLMLEWYDNKEYSVIAKYIKGVIDGYEHALIMSQTLTYNQLTEIKNEVLLKLGVTA